MVKGFRSSKQRMKVMANLKKGCNKEHKEHPSFTKKQACKIASDHLKEDPKAYD